MRTHLDMKSHGEYKIGRYRATYSSLTPTQSWHDGESATKGRCNESNQIIKVPPMDNFAHYPPQHRTKLPEYLLQLLRKLQAHLGIPEPRKRPTTQNGRSSKGRGDYSGIYGEANPQSVNLHAPRFFGY